VNDIVNDQAPIHLGAAATRLTAVLSRPKPIAIACVVILAALGWSACALLPSDEAAGWPIAFCRPALGRDSGMLDFALVLAIWGAMTLAMMLPTAGPMILTYAEIADTAVRKSEIAVSPMMLALGYATVWLGFAAVAAVAQTFVSPFASMSSINRPLAAGLFLLAGLYQFTSLKHACLALCQRPFPYFFANWTTVPRGVFALGLRQGLYCLGCCWAMMLVMFALGAMNVFWMAALGALMTIEKLSTNARSSHAIGLAFIALGVLMIAMGFI
jgi:predicted metal-binding membrane protein